MQRVPIFVGGTGLYFMALTEGLADIPPMPPRSAMRRARCWTTSASKRCMPTGRRAIRDGGAAAPHRSAARVARL